MSLRPRHYGRYFEPFLGGGAVLYFLANETAVACDAYKPLIELWRMVRDEPNDVSQNYARQWEALQADLPAYFYIVRERFNAEPNPPDLLFLSRTCVNGIIRFNKTGQFNNSFHLSRRGMRPPRFQKIVTAWNQRLQGVTLNHCDYEETLAAANKGDFVYLDPPYANNRDRYQQDVAKDHLFEALERLNTRGVFWALSYDGRRGEQILEQELPAGLYRDHRSLPTGSSAVKRVLSGALLDVEESLYRNYV